jgi:biotin carboxylase
MRDKTLLRETTAAAGIANPAFAPVAHLEEAVDFANAHEGPWVLKPTNRQGSVGTQIVTDLDELANAWQAAQRPQEAAFVATRHLPSRLQIEQYIEGSEFSVELLVCDAATVFANVTSKLLHPGPRPIELGHIVPAGIAADLYAALVSATETVLAVLGMRTGVVHCEWIVRDAVPYLVECTGRLPGDGIVELIEHAWPIDLTHRYVTAMLGMPVPPAPAAPAMAAAALFPAVRPGIVESITGLAEAAAVPGVYQSGSTVKPGDRVHELRSSWDRVVGAAACAATGSLALAAAQAAVNKIVVKTLPDNEA